MEEEVVVEMVVLEEEGEDGGRMLINGQRSDASKVVLASCGDGARHSPCSSASEDTYCSAQPDI